MVVVGLWVEEEDKAEEVSVVVGEVVGCLLVLGVEEAI
jgi:hypothetical protein